MADDRFFDWETLDKVENDIRWMDENAWTLLVLEHNAREIEEWGWLAENDWREAEGHEYVGEEPAAAWAAWLELGRVEEERRERRRRRRLAELRWQGLVRRLLYGRQPNSKHNTNDITKP